MHRLAVEPSPGTRSQAALICTPIGRLTERAGRETDRAGKNIIDLLRVRRPTDAAAHLDWSRFARCQHTTVHHHKALSPLTFVSKSFFTVIHVVDVFVTIVCDRVTVSSSKCCPVCCLETHAQRCPQTHKHKHSNMNKRISVCLWVEPMSNPGRTYVKPRSNPGRTHVKPRSISGRTHVQPK